MNSNITTEIQRYFVDREDIRRSLLQLEKNNGRPSKPVMSPPELQHYMLVELGIQPEDNLASCGIIASRGVE